MFRRRLGKRSVPIYEREKKRGEGTERKGGSNAL